MLAKRLYLCKRCRRLKIQDIAFENMYAPFPKKSCCVDWPFIFGARTRGFWFLFLFTFHKKNPTESDVQSAPPLLQALCFRCGFIVRLFWGICQYNPVSVWFCSSQQSQRPLSSREWCIRSQRQLVPEFLVQISQNLVETVGLQLGPTLRDLAVTAVTAQGPRFK